jgi:methyl-accepting chemotaxis protein
MLKADQTTSITQTIYRRERMPENLPKTRRGTATLSIKLIAGFGLVVLVLGLMNLLTYRIVWSAYDRLGGMMDNSVIMSEIDTTVGTIYDHASRYFTLKSEDDRDSLARVFSDNETRLASLAARILDKERVKTIKSLQSINSKGIQLLADMRASVESGAPRETINGELNAFESLQSQYSSTLKSFMQSELDLYRLLKIKLNRDNDRDIRLLLIALSALCAVSLAVTVVFTSRMVRPLRRVAATLREIAEGGGDLTMKLGVASRDEVGALSTAFNAFSDRLEGMIRSIHGSADRLSNVGDRLAEGMGEASSAVEEISANVESIGRLILSQSAGVEESQATVNSIARVAGSLRDHIENQAAALTESSASVEQIVGTIGSVAGMVGRLSDTAGALLSASEDGRSKLSAVNDRITSISSQSEGLLETNEVITGIASQTNLLAMNAAIEAAHAGEAGKGFAVVADEIRRLSENSASQAKSIDAELKAIKLSIDEVVGAARDAEASFSRVFEQIGLLHQLEGTVSDAINEQRSGSKEVLEALANINSVTQAVRAGSTEIMGASEAIKKEMEELSSITGEIKSGMGEISRGATDINASVGAVNELSLANRETIKELRAEVARFKTRED